MRSIAFNAGSLSSNGFSSPGTNVCLNGKKTFKNVSGKTVTGIQVRCANFGIAQNVNTGAVCEQDNATVATLKFALEYPAGVFAPLCIGSQPSNVISSDFLDWQVTGVQIPPGASGAIHYFVNMGSPNLIWPQGPAAISALGEYATASASVADHSQDNMLSPNSGLHYPFLIFGETIDRVQSVLIVGDSIAAGGFGGDTPDGMGNLGFLARALGPSRFIANCGRGGDTAQQFVSVTSGSNQLNYRRRLAMYGGRFSHVVAMMGRNDVNLSGMTLATIQANLTAYWNLHAAFGKPVYACTLPPDTTSTDGWASTGNQTPLATENLRQQVNAWIKTVPAPLAGYFDVEAVLSASPGIWIPGATNDGIHPNDKGVALAIPAVQLPNL